MTLLLALTTLSLLSDPSTRAVTAGPRLFVRTMSVAVADSPPSFCCRRGGHKTERGKETLTTPSHRRT